MIQVYTIHFSCAHFYRNNSWTEETNRNIFGLCYSKEGYGHGHDYTAEIFVKAEANQKNVEQIMTEIVKKFNHKHLNYELPELKNHIPTTENLANSLHKILSAELKPYFQKLKLYETKDLWVETTP